MKLNVLGSLSGVPSPVDSSLLQDNVAFVLCLDTLGNGDTMHLHVSKPPKEGTPQHALLKELEMVSCTSSALTLLSHSASIFCLKKYTGVFSIYLTTE